MQSQLDAAAELIGQSRSELEIVAAGNGRLLVGGPEAVAARLLDRLADAAKLIRSAQAVARKSGAEIVNAVRAAGCSPPPTAGYPGETAGSRVNGQPVRPASVFRGLLVTDAAVQLADAAGVLGGCPACLDPGCREGAKKH